MRASAPSILIVGAGQAGAQIASSLRSLGHTGRIDLIGAEPNAPYQRPPLSKAALRDQTSMESLALRSHDYYRDQQINLHINEHIESITADGNGGVARSASGRPFTFDKLALTVGADPRRLDVPGANASRIHYLRNYHDAQLLRNSIPDARKVVVIGGGFIGLEVAASMRQLAKEVTIILPGQRIMARALSPAVADFVHAHHAGQDVDIRTQTSVARIDTDGHGRAVGVVTSDGAYIPADLIVVGIGATPRTSLAEQLGLAVDDGIVVNEFALASDGYTVAAGDCTNMPNPLIHGLGPARLRLESVNNAIEHAKIAAAALIGDPTPYCGVPWFWSDQYDLKIQAAGILLPGAQAIVRGSVQSGKFSVFHYDGDQLVGVEAVNAPGDFMVARSAMSRGRSIHMDAVADTSVPLKHLVTARTATAGVS